MKSLVLVEDDIMLAEMYQAKLQQAGYICLLAVDGAAGLELIKTKLPDLVLLDLMIPQITGVEVLKQMRASDWGKDIKVLVLTNISEFEAPEGLKELGIEQYLVKANHTPSQVIEIVNRILMPLQNQEVKK